LQAFWETDKFTVFKTNSGNCNSEENLNHKEHKARKNPEGAEPEGENPLTTQ
jgi:hypothetical protein